jgi:clan AA aspartic protease
MKGAVDGSGRAILRISVSNGDSNSTQIIEAWVDTGFTGDLVVPRSIIESLGLEPSGAIDGVLADGTQTLLETYHCEIKWFGRARSLEVIANSGEMSLLGVGLLLAKELTIDYTNLTVSLGPSRRKPS